MDPEHKAPQTCFFVSWCADKGFRAGLLQWPATHAPPGGLQAHYVIVNYR